MTIPKIIHQLWIGPKEPPTNHMNTWKDMNPDFEYIRWNEEELVKRKFKLECKDRIEEIEEICGKADIIRWEILYEYGGIFLDADSICIEPIDDVLMKCKSFAGWENETTRPGLIAVGTMGFYPKHPLVKKVIEWIKLNKVSIKDTTHRAWITTGPVLLTNIYNTGKYDDITILPSYYFLPIHCTGLEYKGHGKIYAHQEWGSTNQNYAIMNTLSLPDQFKLPQTSVSILVSSLNTKASYLKQCLQSIKEQEGLFNMEIVWINDGSDTMHTLLLKSMLKQFEHTTRFTKVIYSENDGNKGLGYSLNKGVTLCNNEIIMRMDSDDIMYPERIKKQIHYMSINTNCILSGAQVQMFKDINNKRIYSGITNHVEVMDVQLFLTTKPHWVMNHPTFCFRKQCILDMGNYNSEIHSMGEDFELILRVLQKYGKIYNMQEPLLYYRLHDKQLTHNGGNEGHKYWMDVRNRMIHDILV